jgi:hypothetical protein
MLGIAFMPKALCIFGTVIAVLLLLVFALDLTIGIPFGGPSVSMLMDIGFIVCAIALGYISWMTLREQK